MRPGHFGFNVACSAESKADADYHSTKCLFRDEKQDSAKKKKKNDRYEK